MACFLFLYPSFLRFVPSSDSLLVVAFGREEVLNTNYRGSPKLEGIVLGIDTYSDAIFILFVKDLIVEQLFQTFKKLAISVCTTGMKWKKLV